jgi:serine/threonine-protein kinase
MPVGGDDETVAGSAPTIPEVGLVDELVANRYRIVRWLGGGGMGRVYEALDTELDVRIALKVLKSGLSEDAVERFRREVRLTRKIQHANVARMFDIGDHGGDKFLTMELVDGESLTRQIGAVIAWPRIKAIAEQVCAGLAAAHRAGVVHRDLKPDNVLIERGSERVVITDFGIARGGEDAGVTQVGAVVGTPRYMAPEQLAGRDVDARADLFSLGVMLFELATGTRPWSGDNAIAVAVAQATTPPRTITSDNVPPWFASLVASCIQLDPAQRPASADDIALAIATGTHHAPTRATVADRPRARPTAPPARTPSEVTTVAVLPVACGSGDEYLADGVLEDLIDTLSSTPGLRVRPAGVVRSIEQRDPRALGAELEVDHVVAASMRRMANGLRIAARLISVADGFQIWAHKTDCADADVLAVSDRIARGVASALSTQAATATRPTDPRAVDLYLRARAELRRFWGSHALAAADLLDQAAEYAPTSAPILGALAYASVMAWVMRGDPQLMPRAQSAVERAMASGHGEAFLASASFRFNSGDPVGAAADLGTALVRAPMSAQAHEMAGKILVEINAVTEARHHFETAIGLDPGRSLVITAELARMDGLESNWDAADARVASLLGDPDPSIAQLGAVMAARLAGWRGRTDAMLGAATQFAPRMGQGASKMIAMLAEAASTGEIDLDRVMLVAEKLGGPQRPRRQQILPLQLVSEVALLLDRDDVAQIALRRAADIGLIDIYWLDACPIFMRLGASAWFSTIRSDVRASAASVLASFRAATIG